MAALLRSGGFLRLFSGFRQSWTSNVPRCEALTLQKLHITQGHASITRLLTAQKHAENVKVGQASVQGIDKALYRIDTDIRRTGRIYKKDIEEIFGEIKALKHASSTQSLLLLRCCGSLVPEELPEVRNKLVQEIWDTLHELRIPLDISHYNTLLRVYLENEHKFSPTEFLADLEKSGIEPNRVTYQRLLSRYCQDGDIEGATKILEFMKEKQLPVGENIFNSLIMGHARANDMESAHKVLDVMKESGLEPSPETYTMLMVSCAEQGDIEGLNSVLEECAAADLHPHDRDLMEVILALSVKGHKQHVPQIIDKLQKVQGYQQDVMNIVFRLLNAGCHEVAYQMFSTMTLPQNAEGQTAPVGFFFIRHLVKSGTPLSVVVQYCQELKKQGMNMYALECALGTALTNGLPQAAMFILRVMNEDGAPLRAHYFWPIIAHFAKLGETEKVYDTVKEMVALETPLTIETFKQYVIPAVIDQSDEDVIIAQLKDAGMSVPSIVNRLVAYHLENGDVLAASKIVSKYQVRLTNVLRRELADAYVKTGESLATTIILGQMINLNQEPVKEDKDSEDEVIQQISRQEQQDVAGLFLLDVLWHAQRNSVANKIEPVLQEMENRGISISKTSESAVKARLGDKENEAVLSLLERLSSGELKFQPLTVEAQVPYHQQSVEVLERRLTELENKNLSTTNVRSVLLTAYARNKDIAKAEEAKKKLDEEQYPIGTGLYILLIDMYVSVGKLTEAITLLHELQKREPEVKLTPVKFLRLAHLMIEEGQVEEAVKLIENNASENINDKESGLLMNIVKRMLDTLADKGDVTTVRQVLQVLLNLKIVPPANIVFGPVIRAHLAKDDLVGAMEEFEKICREHSVTPYKLELTTQFIKLEDAEKLQKIMDLSIKVHGELNSLYDMVFAFIESGRVKQAKKLLETPGLRAYNAKLDLKCQRYVEVGKVAELEHLISVTQDVFDVDRDMMYRHLLKAYKQQNDCDKALGIWTSMQEENIEPSENFLLELGEFLQKNDREIPFVVPEKSLLETQGPEESLKGKFHKALTAKNFTLAVDLKNQLELLGVLLNVRNRSELIEGLVQENQIGEAVKITREMLLSGAHPIQRILRFLMIQVAKAGDVETIMLFGKYIDANMKKRVSYDNLLCLAYNQSGRWEDFVEDLSHEIQAASDTELPHLSQQFPRGGIIGIMDQHADSLPKIMALSEKYASRGILEPANCLWMYLFSEGRHSEAQEIYDKYLSGCSGPLMFRNILDNARKSNNIDLPSKLIEVLNVHPNISSRARGLVYSCWIDILGDANRFEEGLEVLKGALQTLSLEDLNLTSLTRLKAGTETTDKTFPYIVPPKVKRDQQNAQSSSSSSSSSSDSD
ncbi:leucine-rich PPR motif-containing protein, mitochondrial isoform X2 [Panulirus ornatus]|uniref:leucine-rich PPR motif-containing protein, mitochondrial isoform X2 n=1 Tax=Panulirus ornatus TaxID=150431 RepID=UPI003A893C36